MQNRCHFGSGWPEVFNLPEICTEHFCLRPVPQSEISNGLQTKRRKQKGQEQNTAPPNGVGVKNKAIPSTTSTTEAAVSRNEPTEKRNFIMAVNRISNRTTGTINTLHSIFNIFISETSFIISTSILPCTSGDKKDAND